jgi:hypothetical protein
MQKLVEPVVPVVDQHKIQMMHLVHPRKVMPEQVVSQRQHVHLQAVVVELVPWVLPVLRDAVHSKIHGVEMVEQE